MRKFIIFIIAMPTISNAARYTIWNCPNQSSPKNSYKKNLFIQSCEDNGKRSGPWSSHDKNGFITELRWYKNNNKVFQKYFTCPPNTITQVSSAKSSAQFCYFLKNKTAYKEGVESSFDANGQLYKQTSYKNGKKSGPEKVFKNNKLYTQNLFKNGALKESKEWDKDNKLINHVVWENGVGKNLVFQTAPPSNSETSFNRKGMVTRSTSYPDGRKQITKTWLDLDGNNNSEILEYDKDNFMYQRTVAKNNSKKSWSYHKNGKLKSYSDNKTRALYYENGKKSYEFNKSNKGSQSWDKFGNLISTIKKVGDSTIKKSLYNGKVISITAINPKKNTKYIKQFNAQGELIKETPYLNKKINGIVKEYKNNKLWRKQHWSNGILIKNEPVGK